MKVWLLALGVAVLSAPAFGQDYVVVVHSSSDVTVSKSDVANLFLGKSKGATPVMQASSTPAGLAFVKAVLGMSWTQYRSHWSKRMFSGKGYPPERVKSDADVKAFLAKNKNAIGYVSAKSVDGTVKVILKF